jgi:hypothetical protein
VKLSCRHCGKRLSRKTARVIDGREICSACMFAPRKSGETRSVKTRRGLVRRMSTRSRSDAPNLPLNLSPQGVTHHDG